MIRVVSRQWLVVRKVKTLRRRLTLMNADKTRQKPLMNKLRFCGLLLLHLFTSLIGTAIISSFLGRFYTANSFSAALGKEWVLSVVCAALLGFFVRLRFQSSSAAWTWTLPTIWFCVGLLMAFGARGSASAMPNDAGIWTKFSGTGCSEGMRSVACLNFFLFTIPWIRCISYSIGALLCSPLRPTPPISSEHVQVPHGLT
jgi:uncharacterized membrane protein YbjE (DUF340 family)